MAITTLAQAKLILGITGTTQDALITALIPMVEQDYLAIRNRPFDIGATLTINTGAGVAGNITVTIDGGATIVAVLAGDTATRVAWKIKLAIGDGYHYTSTISGAVLTITSIYADTEVTVTFTDTDTTGVTATVSDTDVIYPTGAEMTAIEMIEHRLSKKPVGVASESLGDHSVSYAAMNGKYPIEVTKGIKRFVGWT